MLDRRSILQRAAAWAGTAAVLPKEASSSVDRPNIRAACGTLVGTEAGRVRRFAAIPFAQPPIGKLRFRHLGHCRAGAEPATPRALGNVLSFFNRFRFSAPSDRSPVGQVPGFRGL
jgi:hypothetical protein